jgi:hypothetical protein
MMITIKPPKLIPIQEKITGTDLHDKLTAAEQGKLWATYIGNTMSKCVLKHMLKHVEDPDIKSVLENALSLSEQFVQIIKEIYAHEKYPIPLGFTDEDVNEDAPRLFSDEFYLHYLKYVGKSGISLYGIAVPIVTRSDIREFFVKCMEATIQFLNQVNEALLAKGLLVKPPFIPYPKQIDFIKKESYLHGFFGDIRPLQSLEITHIYDNIVNNATSKGVLIAFSQVAKLDRAKAFFLEGKGIAEHHYDVLTNMLQKEGLSSPSIIDPMVTMSTVSPFSDKLMVFHKLDMFTMRIRAYGNALSMCARHDIAAKFSQLILDVGKYVHDGADVMIDFGWLEQPPQAADRESLISK